MRVSVTDGGEARLVGAPRARLHWRRNKRPAVDLAEHPFAIERQLEDQRMLMLRNRGNDSAVGAESRRSERVLGALARGAEDRGARLVGEIVRTETGVTGLLPPPRRARGRRRVLDPDTLPLLEPYRSEALARPAARSFGHRPASASRTFHPASMQVRLRHGEIATAPGPEASGFGLPASTLAALLSADPPTRADSALDPSDGENPDPLVADFFDDKFNYDTTLRSGEHNGQPWNSSHHVVERRRREPRHSHLIVPAAELIRRSNETSEVSRSGHHRIESSLQGRWDSESLKGSSKSAVGSAIEARRRNAEVGRQERVRRFKHELALSRVPVVPYHPLKLRETASLLPACSDEEAELEQLRDEFNELSRKTLSPDSFGDVRVSSTVSIGRVYGTGTLSTTHQRTITPSTTMKSAAEHAIKGLGPLKTKTRALGAAAEVAKAISGGGADPLFDFIMQREGMAESIEREDEELVKYLEEKLFRERRRSLAETDRAGAVLTSELPRSIRPRRKQSPRESPMVVSSLYTRGLLDFERRDRVDELQREVNDLQLSLRRVEGAEAVASARDADSVGEGSSVDEDLSRAASDLFSQVPRENVHAKPSAMINKSTGRVEGSSRSWADFDVAEKMHPDLTEMNSALDSDGEERSGSEGSR